MAKMQLFTFWRSQASYRVRIALHLKGIAFEGHTINLLKGEQFSDAYRKVNPEAVVPTLIDGDTKLIQSLAILDYLEEAYPDPAILPKSLADRAYSRALAQIVAMEAHTLLVPRIRKYLETELGLDEAARLKWIRHWNDTASTALEETIARDPRTGKFCIGDTPTIADICLAPHIASTIMLYNNDISSLPTVKRIYENCMALDAFSETHPLKQPDAAPGEH